MNSILTNEIMNRRQKFISQMDDDSIAIFFAAPEAMRSNDTHYPYRQNSDFWYLTQFNEPESILILIKDSKNQNQTILFNRNKDPLAEIWTGYRLGQEAALTELNVDKAYSFDLIYEYLPSIVSGKSTLYHAKKIYPYADNIIKKLMRILVQQDLRKPNLIKDWRPILHEMRLFKSEYEINILRQAGRISALGHIKAMQKCKADMFEYHLESEILHEFAKHGARFPSYNTIVGSGNNGCILHYENNCDKLKEGDLVLIDAGCEYQGYAGDITRTFPVNGKFTRAQREIYDIVLTAQKKAIELFKPNISIKEVNDHVIRILVAGLIELNILNGNIDELIESKEYSKFYMHGIGHWLGIDVHDVSHHKIPARDRKLQPGMVLTVEPGLYINKNVDVPEQYKGIGIRIEDDIVITIDGNEILTKDVPKDPCKIEKLMQ